MRHAFFVFDYDNDLGHAKELSGSGGVKGSSAAGFDDAAAFRQAQQNGDAAVKKLIDAGLDGTSATVVVIGQNTANLDYVNYALAQSLKRQNGILGVFVGGARGAVPFEKEASALTDAHGYHTVDGSGVSLAEEIEHAATDWKRFARPKPLGSHG